MSTMSTLASIRDLTQDVAQAAAAGLGALRSSPSPHYPIDIPYRRFWRSGGVPLLKAGRGSDELGRHTLYLASPLGFFVFAVKPCDCEDMASYRCTFPNCPWIAMVGDSPCLVHDFDYNADQMLELATGENVKDL